MDRGGASSSAANRVQDIVGGALGVMNMASSMMGGAVNLAGGSLNIQLLNQLGIDPSTITNQVFVANVSCSCYLRSLTPITVCYQVKFIVIRQHRDVAESDFTC